MTPEKIGELARRVRRGVKVLDKRMPNWRRVLRTHSDQFNFSDPACCVIGTLVNHTTRFKKLRERATHEAFGDAVSILTRSKQGDPPADYGFDIYDGEGTDDVYPALSALWKAEAEMK